MGPLNQFLCSWVDVRILTIFAVPSMWSACTRSNFILSCGCWLKNKYVKNKDLHDFTRPVTLYQHQWRHFGASALPQFPRFFYLTDRPCQKRGWYSCSKHLTISNYLLLNAWAIICSISRIHPAPSLFWWSCRLYFALSWCIKNTELASKQWRILLPVSRSYLGIF